MTIFSILNIRGYQEHFVHILSSGQKFFPHKIDEIKFYAII